MSQLLPLLPLTALTQHEVSLAEFTAKLRAFRPAATVLEAEIAKVRGQHCTGSASNIHIR
jgi:hypothetical protein